jgi:hypothetical protein
MYLPLFVLIAKLSGLPGPAPSLYAGRRRAPAAGDCCFFSPRIMAAAAVFV